MPRLRVGSLFSGIGGFDLGLERAGHQVVFQAEADVFRRDVLAARFPGRLTAEDVHDVDIFWPRVDLLVGGFPCQDLSVAGKRAGLAGDRSGLFFEFVRIAEALEPEWLLIENVPGLFSSNRGADFGTLIDTLANVGYEDLAWRVLDSRHFGVAQRRRRVFILARRGSGAGRASAVLLEPESVRRDSPPRSTAGEEVAGTLGGGSGRRGWCDDLDRSGAFLPAFSRTLTAHHGRSDGDTETFVEAYQCHGSNVGPMPFIAAEVNALTGSWGHAGADENDAQGGKLVVLPDVLAFHAQQDPIYDDEVTPALSRGAPHGQGSIGVQYERVVRRLTPVECERLQGFPDGWTCLCDEPCSSIEPRCTLGRRYAALGDAVTVPVAEWLGQRLGRYG